MTPKPGDILMDFSDGHIIEFLGYNDLYVWEFKTLTPGQTGYSIGEFSIDLDDAFYDDYIKISTFKTKLKGLL